MNTQQTLAGYRTTTAFVNELSKHFKITKTCDSDDILSCFEDKIYWGTDAEEIDMSEITTAADFGQDDWGTEIIGTMFAYGVTALIAYNPDCVQNPYSNRVDVMNCIAILYDTDGFKNPNTSSKDVRQNDNVKSLGNSCYKELNGICLLNDAFEAPVMSFADCKKNKAELNITACCPECDAKGGDTFAGAVKTCHDLGGRLPEFYELYDMTDDLSELGFELVADRASIWTNGPGSSSYITSALCVQGGTCSMYSTNRFGSLWSICVKD